MAVDRVLFKGGAMRLTGEVRGCEPEIMAAFAWPWPWPFEVIGYGASGEKQVVAVCRDHDAAIGALRDWSRSQGSLP